MKSQETKNLADYIRKNHVNLSNVAKSTGVPYAALYGSLFDSSKDRDLRAGEFFAVCRFLKVNPMDFADKEGGE